MSDQDHDHDHPTMIVWDFDGAITEAGRASQIVNTLRLEWLASATLNGLDKGYSALQKVKQTVLPINLHLATLKRATLAAISPIRPDIQFLADYSKLAGIRNGLITSNVESWSNRLGRHLEIPMHFDHSQFLGRAKTPEDVLASIEAMSGPERKEKILAIGDTASDMEVYLQASNMIDHELIPVALGAETSAARKLRELSLISSGQARVFDTIADMGMTIAFGDSVFDNESVRPSIRPSHRTAPKEYRTPIADLRIQEVP